MESHAVRGAIPENAVTAALEMHMDRDQGSDADGYFDNISFVVGTSSNELTTDEDTALIINADTLLANDNDVDGGMLSITAVSEEVLDSEGNVVGTAAQDKEGNLVFTPGDALDSLAEGENKAVNFTYTVSDGQGGTDNKSC